MNNGIGIARETLRDRGRISSPANSAIDEVSRSVGTSRGTLGFGRVGRVGAASIKTG